MNGSIKHYIHMGGERASANTHTKWALIFDSFETNRTVCAQIQRGRLIYCALNAVSEREIQCNRCYFARRTVRTAIHFGGFSRWSALFILASSSSSFFVYRFWLWAPATRTQAHPVHSRNMWNAQNNSAIDTPVSRFFTSQQNARKMKSNDIDEKVAPNRCIALEMTIWNGWKWFDNGWRGRYRMQSRNWLRKKKMASNRSHSICGSMQWTRSRDWGKKKKRSADGKQSHKLAQVGLIELSVTFCHHAMPFKWSTNENQWIGI